MFDLVLSSGFLAFARQAGFLQAVEESGVDVGGIVGTSSGALAGSLWLAGMDSNALAAEFTRDSPLASCTPHLRIWRGLFTMHGVIARLSELMPATFEELDRPFGVGVMTADGGHRLVTSGPLPQAVAASMAIPRLFEPVVLDGTPCADGAFVDRTAHRAWEAHRGHIRTLIHLVDSSGKTNLVEDLGDRPVVRTRVSGAKLWDLGDFAGQREEARAAAHAVISRA
jgi:predicted acylesterase/phospholipase RssA